MDVKSQVLKLLTNCLWKMSQTWWMRLRLQVFLQHGKPLSWLSWIGKPLDIRVPVSEYPGRDDWILPTKIVLRHGASECLNDCGWFCPVFAPWLLSLLFFFYLPTTNIIWQRRKRLQWAWSMAEGFKSRARKEIALGDPNQCSCTLLGSSFRCCRLDIVHPAVLAEKYDRSYRPYFSRITRGASLNQYFGCSKFFSTRRKAAVYVVSPQWFAMEVDVLWFTAFQQYFLL